MTYYSDAGVSTCQIAGSIAVAAIHDLQVNNFTFGGFPQVLVVEPADETFTVHLSFERKDQKALATLQLTRKEAFATAKHFNKNKGAVHDPAIFKRVQDALVGLEGQTSDWWR